MCNLKRKCAISKENVHSQKKMCTLERKCALSRQKCAISRDSEFRLRKCALIGTNVHSQPCGNLGFMPQRMAISQELMAISCGECGEREKAHSPGVHSRGRNVHSSGGVHSRGKNVHPQEEMCTPSRQKMCTLKGKARTNGDFPRPNGDPA